jgi:hypothetical protein
MGYSSEMPVDRCYRDSRINRIFEGTNEINRILVIDTLLKKGQKKDIDLYEQGEAAYQSLGQMPDEPVVPADYYGRKAFYTGNLKQLALCLIHGASAKFQRNLIMEQEILINLADIIMNIYVTESTMLRVQKIGSMTGEEAAAVYRDILDVNLYDSTAAIYRAAMDAVNSFAEGTGRSALIEGIKYWTITDPVNVRDARRRIAAVVIDENRYSF